MSWLFQSSSSSCKLLILAVHFNRVYNITNLTLFSETLLCNIKSPPNFNKTIFNHAVVCHAMSDSYTNMFKSNVGEQPDNKRPKCISSQCTESDPDPMLKNWQINQRKCCNLPLSLVSKDVFIFK